MAQKVLEVEFRAKDGLSQTLIKQGLTAEQTARKLKEIGSAKRPRFNADEEGGGLEGGLKDIGHSLGSQRAVSHLIHGGIAGAIGHVVADSAEKLEQAAEKFRADKL